MSKNIYDLTAMGLLIMAVNSALIAVMSLANGERRKL